MRIAAAIALPLAIVLALATTPARSDCAVELILAVDVSGSVDDREWTLQVDGIAGAFEEPAVIEAINALAGPMLVTLTHWSGVGQQRQATGWHIVGDEASAGGFAAAVRGAYRPWLRSSTAVGEALAHAGRVGRTAPLRCARRVIDISGDGHSNEGPFPGPIADALAAEGYQVNALAIQGSEENPAAFFELEVIAGDGAFVETAADFDDFPRAFRRKLLREIGSDLVVGRAG